MFLPKRLCIATFALTASLGVVASSYAGAAVPKLRTEINAYYKAEKSNDWRKVYLLRTSAFREHVIERDFMIAMAKYNTGWRLDDVKILAIRHSGERATVEARFTLAPPPRFWKGSGFPVEKHLNLFDKVIWVREAGGWRCEQSSSLAHLPFTQ